MRNLNESVILTARTMGCLTEMFVEGKRNLQDGAQIIAYRSKIWVLPEDQELSKRMRASIAKELQGANKFKELSNLEERPDVLQAEYNNGSLVISHGLNFANNAETSVLVKKVAQTLGVKRVIHADSERRELSRHRPNDLSRNSQAPTWGYHGTSSQWLLSILSGGLTPKPDKTNFDGIKHHRHVFLTLDGEKASFHAVTAVMPKKKSDNYFSRHRQEEEFSTHHPIIIKTNVPDPALIDADFDIDRESGQTAFTVMHKKFEISKRDKGLMPGDPKKLSQRLGVFGYLGRILPQSFTEISIGPKFDTSVAEPIAFEDYDTYPIDFFRKWLKALYDETGELDHWDLKDFMNNPQSQLEDIRGDREEEEE